MSAETDIAAIDDGGANTAAEVRTALTSVLGRADAAGVSFLGAAVPGTITWITPTTTRKYAHKITMPADGVILSVGAYLRQTVANVPGHINVAVYTDDSGQPGLMLALNTGLYPGDTFLMETATPTPHWMYWPINAPAPAADYWAVWWCQDSSSLDLATDATTGAGTGISGYMTAGGGWFTDKGASGHSWTATADEEQVIRAHVLT